MSSGKNSSAAGKLLLIELGTEELPPKALKGLAQSFSATFYQELICEGLVEDNPADMKWYATPRRLAVTVRNVLERQPDRVETIRGPALQAAYDEHGAATRAAQGFARSCGVPLSALKTRQTEKGAWLVFEKRLAGSRLDEVVTRCLNQSIKSLPIPKRMRWGENEAEFVRPVHWLLALYGSDLVRVEALGLESGRTTRGHRFHSAGHLEIPSADQYLKLLKTDGRVIADYDERQTIIKKQATRLASKAGARIVIQQGLLDEVTSLVEWPVALAGEFDRQFLELPGEVLISTMAGHQKYFHVVDDRNKLVPVFVTISNIKSKSPKRVRQGNERVLRARLSDARFFWQTDQKIPLKNRVKDLNGVLFHDRLGSIHDKVTRIRSISGFIAGQLDVDPKAVDTVAELCKADLVTDLVGEFPELQGTVGRYYADNEGYGKSIADAIEAHYKPRTAADTVPSDPVAICVALADRVDSLIGLFGCGEAPSGDKDPFALRRAALGVFRIIVENQLDLDLKELYAEGVKKYIVESFRFALGVGPAEYGEEYLQPLHSDRKQHFYEAADRVYDFTMERSKGYFELQGYSTDEYAAVSAARPAPTRPVDFARRIEAIHTFFNDNSSAAQSLASANKRIGNMLKGDAAVDTKDFDSSVVCDPVEKDLAAMLDRIGDQVHSRFQSNDYAGGLVQLAGLKDPVDRFFDSVMVMHQDKTIRRNRLALLARIRQLFLGVADISKIRIKS